MRCTFIASFLLHFSRSAIVERAAEGGKAARAGGNRAILFPHGCHRIFGLAGHEWLTICGVISPEQQLASPIIVD
jgi:hypothetical protein